MVNPVAAYRFEKSKALQLGLFERVGARYPRSLVVNHPIQALAALDGSAFRSSSSRTSADRGPASCAWTPRRELESRLDRLDLGPDGTALVQEYIEPVEGAIVRVEVLAGEYLYAIRIVRDAGAGFNLCPADICQAPERRIAPPSADLGACPVSPPAG